MYNKRHANLALYAVAYTVLAASIILVFTSICLAFNYRAVADEAKHVADESMLIAEAALDAAAKYQKENKQLVETNDGLREENATLREAIRIYNDEWPVEPPTPPRYFNVAMPEELQSYIWTLCCDYGIDEYYELVYALIKHESKFDAAARSHSRDWGLMQINECNHAWLGEELGIVDFLDPYQNVHGGIYILAKLLHKYDMSDALMAYNMGEYGASELWRRGIHSTNYSRQVLDYYKQFTGDI